MSRSLFTKWLINIFIFILLIATTCAVLFVLLPTYSYSGDYYAALIDKHKLLESTRGSRVIVAGGSNVALGLDSERLASLLNKTVINDGLNAGLGMRFILTDLAPFIHSGDIVVLSPEYETFFGDSLEGGNAILADLLDVYPQAVQSFDFSQFVRLPNIFMEVLQSRFIRLANLWISPANGENPIYSRAGFNRYGDMISHLGKPNVSNIDGSAYIKASDSYNLTVIDVFNRFAKQAKAKGATVVLIYPPSRMTNYINTQGRLEQLDTYLRKHLEFPILSHPIDSCFADKYFYDTAYHLNADGRQMRTLQLAEVLIKQGVVIVNPGKILPSK